MIGNIEVLPSSIPSVWSRYTDLVVNRGEASWLVTATGDRYLDYTSGIGVTSTGHAHPRVVRAIQNQAERLLHGQQNIVFHEPGMRLHTRLANLLPDEDWSVFLSNSGAEAVEAAVKLARAATKRPIIIAFRGGFHGRTAQAMALTTSGANLRTVFEPLPPSVYHASYPYCYRSPVGSHAVTACVCPWEADLEMLFRQISAPDRVAACIVEPILGEGGYIVPPPEFLPRLREITRQHGILLIADEIQTGFGRTGALFAVNHWDVVPDILVMAKGIASGLPLSGIIARRDLMDAWAPGAHGGTYGGNVLACAAANATLDVIEDENLVQNAVERGKQLLAGCELLSQAHDEIGDVRGLGLMVGMEFVDPTSKSGREPDGALAKRVLSAALKRKLLALSAGSFGQVVRLIPPLVTSAEEVDWALQALADSVSEACEGR